MCRNFHKAGWKIFPDYEIPTAASTENLVQECITLPFLGSSGTSLLVNYGHVLAVLYRQFGSLADGLVLHSFSRLGSTVLWLTPGYPPLGPGSDAVLDWLNLTLASFRGAATFSRQV